MLATATPAFVPTDYEWLRLRFEADRRSRSDALLSRVREHCTGRPTLRVLDLGAGAGANLVYLAPRLPVDEQDWVLVDRDGALLDRVPACCRALGSASPSMEVEPGRLRVGGQRVRYQTIVGDFVTDARVYEGRWDLVVANAVFDLLPEPAIARFFERARWAFGDGCPPLYFTLNLDAGPAFHPESPEDEPVRALFHAHMRRPQALGRALGPESARAVARIAERFGFIVHAEQSPWQLGPSEDRMLHANLDFVENAVTEMVNAERGTARLGFGIDALARWMAARRAQVDRGELSLTVAHRDLWLTPGFGALAR